MTTALYISDWLCEEHFLLAFSTTCIFLRKQSRGPAVTTALASHTFLVLSVLPFLLICVINKKKKKMKIRA